MNLLLLGALAQELDAELRGRAVGPTVGLAPVLSLRAGDGSLVVLTASPGPICMLSPVSPLEGVQAPALFAGARGKCIAAVRLLAVDRILQVKTECGLSLIVYLYGSAARVILKQDHHVLESFGRRARSEDDNPPAGASIIDVTAQQLASAPDAAVRGLEGPLRDAFTSAGRLDTTALCRFRDDVMTGHVPFSLDTSRSRVNAVPVPTNTDAAMGPFDSALVACAALTNELLPDANRAIVNRIAQPLRRKLAADRKLAVNLEKDVTHAKGYATIRREAETLAAFQAKIPHGASTVDLPDVYDAENTLEIALDPSKALHTQIEKRFRRATKLEKSLIHAGRRLELVRAEIDALTASVTALDAAPTLKEAMQHFETVRGEHDLSSSVSPRHRGRENAERTDRRYELADGWFVLVGRNNRENDDLTFHRAAPQDLWLHAQSVPGSHVILKKDGPADNPPSRVLEMAAAVAAHYSKARHSSLVPVIYTQRRYVRKFRGAAPGQVRCERERMIMVPPGLPRG